MSWSMDFDPQGKTSAVLTPTARQIGLHIAFLIAPLSVSLRMPLSNLSADLQFRSSRMADSFGWHTFGASLKLEVT